MPQWDAFLKEHAALVVTAIGAVFVVTRLTMVSSGSYETAAIILESRGTASVIINSLVNILPSLPLLVGSIWLQWAIFEYGRPKIAAIWPWGVALLISGFVTPISLVLIMTIPVLVSGLAVSMTEMRSRSDAKKKSTPSISDSPLDEKPAYALPDDFDPADWETLEPLIEATEGIIGTLETERASQLRGIGDRIAVVRRGLERLRESSLAEPAGRLEAKMRVLHEIAAIRESAMGQASRVIKWTVFGIVGSTFAISALSSTPWLPKERLSTGSEQIIGYVLRVEDGVHTVLKDDPRIVVRVSEVRSRIFCTAPMSDNRAVRWLADSRPLFSMRSPRVEYQECL